MKRAGNSIVFFTSLMLSGIAFAQSTETVAVVTKTVSRAVDLPAEIQPYLSVLLHARVAGYVEKVLVDRGSAVAQGDTLIEMSAPEMQSGIASARAKVSTAMAEKAELDSQLAAAQSTFDKLKKAAETPGAVAANEIVLAEKQVETLKAALAARGQAVAAAEAAVKPLEDMQAYLKIAAPFAGIVTERQVHPGALADPSGLPLLTLQQISKLRIVVAVPEEDLSGLAAGAAVSFQVPAWPDRKFSGTVARISHSLDQKTRTMPVEVDTANPGNALAPGMYATVQWPVRRTQPSLFVPKTSVVTTTERTFVIRNHDGKAEWVDVRKGAPDGDLIEVLGSLRPGDKVLRRATDEVRDGSPMPSSAR